MADVITTLGILPDTDLETTLAEQDSGNTVCVSREWVYKGADPALAEHVGTVVRRDAWVTIKCGHSAGAIAGV